MSLLFDELGCVILMLIPEHFLTFSHSGEVEILRVVYESPLFTCRTGKSCLSIKVFCVFDDFCVK